LEEDEAMLAAGMEMYSNERNCVVMRLGEKRVLQWYAKLGALAEELLNKSLSDVRSWLTAHPHHTHESYVTRVVSNLLKEQR